MKINELLMQHFTFHNILKFYKINFSKQENISHSNE